MKMLAVALLQAVVTFTAMPAQIPPPSVTITTCNLTPAGTDQICVGLVNSFGFTVPMAIVITNTLQGVGAAGAVSAADLNAIRAQQIADERQETGDIQNLRNKLDADAAKETADIAILTGKVASIPSGPPGPPGIQGPPGASSGTVTPLQVTTSNITSASIPVRLNDASCYPIVRSAGWINTAGQTMDFTVPVSSAGGYFLSSCVGSVSGTAVYRIEYPIGTKIGSSLTAPATSWTTYSFQDTTARLNLPQGNVVIRVVCETPGFNYAGFNLHF